MIKGIIIIIIMMTYGFGTIYSQSDSNDIYWDVTVNDHNCGTVRYINTIAHSNDSIIYLGGNMVLCDDTARHICKYNVITNEWSDFDPLNSTRNDTSPHIINSIVVNGNNVYVGGLFYKIGNIRANSIAKWNGVNWVPLGEGVNGSINSMKINGNDLYVCGLFDSAGKTKSNSIAKWNGKNWSSIGGGIVKNNNRFYPTYLNALSIIGSNLFIGGKFDSVGGIKAKNIAKWNGTKWSSLGEESIGIVNTMTRIGSKLYIGGEYDTLNKSLRSSLLEYDTSNGWSTIGGGLTATVNCIQVSNGKLYVGGAFKSINGVPANYIAEWDGLNWTRLGSGLNSIVSTMCIGKTGLYVSGSFWKAGGKESQSSFARYINVKDTTTEFTINEKEITSNLKILNENIPQPFKEETKFTVNIEEPKEVTISVLNDKGQLIEVIYKGKIEGEKEFKWNGKGESNGIYYYRITGNGINETKKFILVK